MSAIKSQEGLEIDRIAIIGAGPCGLAGAKYLAAEKKFSKIEVFDQRAEPGGVWNYTSLSVVDKDFTIPRTQPTTSPDTAIFDSSRSSPSSSLAQFVSPVYDHLETNIPHTLMNYSDKPFPSNSSLFPPHQEVKQYLHSYASDLKPCLSLQTQVQSIHPVTTPSGEHAGWSVRVLDLRTNQPRTSHFDAVLIASGHYNDPFIPSIPGLSAYHAHHPTAVSHSKFYRRPEQYTNKKVIIVGNSASGIDLSSQISTVCKLPIIVSEKSKPNSASITGPKESKPGVKSVPEIKEFIPSTRSVIYADGTTDSDIDNIIFCTGYFYSFPFLNLNPSSPSSSSSSPTTTTPSPLPSITTSGTHCQNLYNHMLYHPLPTLAFLGIPSRIVPFPVAEAQAAYISRLWSSRLPIPSSSTMTSWLENHYASRTNPTGNLAGIHTLSFPGDVQYINDLHTQSSSATPRPEWGLDNDGHGKLPPYWGADKAWVRERIPLVKVASRKLGGKRHEIKSLEELGFDYAAWKREQEDGSQVAEAAKGDVATIEVKEVGQVQA